MEKIESEDAPKIDVKEVIEQRRLSQIMMVNKLLKHTSKKTLQLTQKLLLEK
ncbi:hypothetical protein V9K46_002261 [Vibrio parahaemolyticus]